MASPLTIATICLLLGEQITKIQAPIPHNAGRKVVSDLAKSIHDNMETNQNKKRVLPLLALLPAGITAAKLAAAAGVVSAGASLATMTIKALTLLPYKVTMGMEVDNWTRFNMVNPEVTVKSGVIATSPVPVLSGQKEAMVARKTAYSATGTFGVVSWEIEGKSRRVVVMWSVPYHYYGYRNTLAVGITKQNANHDGGWADQMYNYGSNAWIGFERKEYYDNVKTVAWEAPDLGLIVFATMGTVQHAVVQVTLSAKVVGDLAKPIQEKLG
ncbi:tereporin-Ca1-like [Dreissena polymorpha]|uniref:Uncharacterized protein n=1 Tax=Dreissena polymorpha TaxID=45954 RepID=A0A9D4EG15_DREPO|nr:tereporin-Ca1-like [Dreissena polymorpha]KAH3777407.1 hypothetical protein DPMN_178850 [Dreissena polymorpha]